jgi:glutaminase
MLDQVQRQSDMDLTRAKDQARPAPATLDPERSEIELCLAQIHEKFARLIDGNVATYIPELRNVDPDRFGIGLATLDGTVYGIGDCEVPFTIQSISKPLLYAMALEDRGLDYVLARVGVEPSGDAFNAIVFDKVANRPFNPMVNSGAIATTAMIKGATEADRLERVLHFMASFAGNPLEIDEAVYLSERATGHRNRAIAHLMLSLDMIEGPIDDAVDLYFKQCSVRVTCRDLALMAATLANGGINPVSRIRVLGTRYARQVLGVMNSCGMYDYAGEWGTRVGLPAKSGVSGGIIAVLPGQLGISVYSPRLDSHGNSVRAIKVCEELSDYFGLSMFENQVTVKTTVARNLRGGQVRSKRLRPPAEATHLDQVGNDIAVYALQGDLVFASVEQILRRLHSEKPAPRFVVLDFKHVSSLHDAAAKLIEQSQRALARIGRTLVIASLRTGKSRRAILETVGVPRSSFFDDADLAMEWCEERLLAEWTDRPTSEAELPLSEIELLKDLSEADIAVVTKNLAAHRFAAGELILREGDPGDKLFFLTKGTASIQVSLGDGRKRRLATISAGLAFGEMSMLDGGTRSADLRADQAVRCYSLSTERLREIGRTQPQILTTILGNLARALSARLRQANNEIRALEK